MRDTHLTLPELALIAGTRAALGAGLGLLLADRLPVARRKAIGWSLLIGGLVSTVPLAIDVLAHRDPGPREDWQWGHERIPRSSYEML
jgi:hypothetical protein